MSTPPELNRVPAELDPMSDRPIYKQISDWIHGAIDTGVLRPDMKLPSESDLMKRFDTTRTTVRRAIKSLVEEGRVRTERGVGAFVRRAVRPDALIRRPYDRMARHHYLDEGRSPLYLDAESQGLAPEAVRQDLVELDEVPASNHVAIWLDVPPGTTVFRRRRRLWMGRLPTQLTETYLPLDIASGALREPHTGEGGTHARIEERGYRLTEFVERLSVRMPNPFEIRRLRLDDGTPVVDLTQTSYAGDRPVECFTAVIAGDRYVYKYDINTSDIDAA
jgi:GntR family transcriptional regulator